jgi:hypothetical protein
MVNLSFGPKELVMRRSRRLGNADPYLLLATTAAAVVVVLLVIALADMWSFWIVAITAVAAIAAGPLLAIVVSSVVADDAESTPDENPAVWSGTIVPGPDFTGPSAASRLLVVTSEPVDPRVILRAATSHDADLALDRLGVMVVSPEGFGRLEVTNDERHYARARDAVESTVAGLRRAGIAAAGHVGDHDAACAVDDALFLFPAQRTLVFAHGPLADEYRRRLGARTVEIIELFDEPVAIRARAARP